MQINHERSTCDTAMVVGGAGVSEELLAMCRLYTRDTLQYILLESSSQSAAGFREPVGSFYLAGKAQNTRPDHWP